MAWRVHSSAERAPSENTSSSARPQAPRSWLPAMQRSESPIATSMQWRGSAP